MAESDDENAPVVEVPAQKKRIWLENLLEIVQTVKLKPKIEDAAEQHNVNIHPLRNLIQLLKQKRKDRAICFPPLGSQWQSITEFVLTRLDQIGHLVLIGAIFKKVIGYCLFQFVNQTLTLLATDSSGTRGIV